MEGEFNNLNINNAPITFSVATNNIATSDETSADPIYQRQMGTNFSKAKKVSKGITIVGISIAFTAIAVSTGSVLKNIFIVNPPEIKNAEFVISEGTFSYSFSVTNKQGYKITYLLDVNGGRVLEEDCTEAKDYSGEYSPLVSGDKCKFFIQFTNSFDYYKTILTKEFVID